jgi:choline dehydrogenase
MYDYVIVGAGSAGCVLASRLTEDPDVRVCLIEAGGADTTESIHVPAMFGSLFRTQHDWDYATHHEPQLDRRRVYLPRGKGLGGSSSINAMVYIRGNRLDYDEWGIPGWTYDDLLPYFIRAEDNERGASELHGAGGPLAVSEGRSNNPISQAFVEAAAAAGHARNPDFNGTQQDGVGAYQVTIRDGRRCSASVAYLHPALGRPNLTVETHLQVHRIVFDGARAIGVEGQRLGELLQLRAEREVILAAGAYNSPQLLMLSGIGPGALLEPLQIPIVLDQPLVGQNLQDHPNCGLVYTHSQPVDLTTAALPEVQQQYMTTGTGPLASNVAEVGGFARSRADLPAPDLQFHAAPALYADEGLAPATAPGFALGTCVVKPRSRGYVSLASADPTAKPIILHNYYAEPEDVESALAGLRMSLEIAAQEPVRLYTEAPYQVPASDRDEDLLAHMRQSTMTLYHPVGTCAMGAVVDDDLRVQGVEGLRVVDASVMPTVTRGNTNAPTIAIAERASDLILGRSPARGREPALAG